MQAILEQPAVAQAGELRAYQGGYFRVLVAPGQTDGDLAMLEFMLPRGTEPPRHLHIREDEAFYVLEGEISFYVGDAAPVHAKAGDAAFGPRQVPHHYVITTPYVRMISVITPGNFSGFFMSQSRPLAAPCAPTPPPGRPSPEVIQHLQHLLREEYGVMLGL